MDYQLAASASLPTSALLRALRARHTRRTSAASSQLTAWGSDPRRKDFSDAFTHASYVSRASVHAMWGGGGGLAALVNDKLSAIADGRGARDDYCRTPFALRLLTSEAGN